MLFRSKTESKTEAEARAAEVQKILNAPPANARVLEALHAPLRYEAPYEYFMRTGKIPPGYTPKTFSAIAAGASAPGGPTSGGEMSSMPAAATVRGAGRASGAGGPSFGLEQAPLSLPGSRVGGIEAAGARMPGLSAVGGPSASSEIGRAHV